MKRMKEVPKSVLDYIRNENESNISDIKAIKKSYIHFCTFPVRPARMKILGENGASFRQTIVPATTVYVRKGAFLDEEHIDRDCLSYFVAGTGRPFPLAHVYSGSGSICLGSIFVPNKISIYTPQLPLETLFLHNDRVLSHGHASLMLDEETVDDVLYILASSNIVLGKDIKKFIILGYNLLKDDIIWQVAAAVYQQKGLKNALELMGTIYNCIFMDKKGCGVQL